VRFGGYAGKILIVDLTGRSISKEDLDEDLVKSCIGGAGINNKLARRFIPPSTEPLSPSNSIIIGTGPFNGTFIPGASETMSVYKSPLNGAFPHSNGGGSFSLFLKSCGYDHIVITGRSLQPVYLLISDIGVEVRDASDIWGMDGFDTADELRKRHGPCSIIPIGPAGEKKVAISVTHIDKGGTIGSGGLAAVMGSKNLKAIVVCMGSNPIGVADPIKLQTIVDELLNQIQNYRRRPEMMTGGAMTMTSEWMSPGILARNSSELIPYPDNIGEIKKQLYAIHTAVRRKIACASCPMSDKDRIDLPDGKSIYDTAVFMEMAAITYNRGLGYMDSGNAMDKYAMAMRYYDQTNRLGIDRVYNFHGIADFIVTLYEKGIITKADTNGFELDRSYETLMKLAEITAYRRDLGDWLADGVIMAARIIGRGAEEHVHNFVKNQYVAFDPRMTGFLPLHFGQLIHPGRTLGVSAAMGAPSYSPGWPIDEIKKQAKRCGVPASDIDRLITNESFNIGRLARHGEDFFGLFNMLGLCHRLYISRFYSMQMIAELYEAVTGIKTSAQDLKLAAAAMWKDWRALNAEAGFTRADDQPPSIWFTPLKSQGRDYELYDYFLKKRLTRGDIEYFLDEYYAEREIA